MARSSKPNKNDIRVVSRLTVCSECKQPIKIIERYVGNESGQYADINSEVWIRENIGLANEKIDSLNKKIVTLEKQNAELTTNLSETRKALIEARAIIESQKLKDIPANATAYAFQTFKDDGRMVFTPITIKKVSGPVVNLYKCIWEKGATKVTYELHDLYEWMGKKSVSNNEAAERAFNEGFCALSIDDGKTIDWIHCQEIIDTLQLSSAWYSTEGGYKDYDKIPETILNAVNYYKWEVTSATGIKMKAYQIADDMTELHIYDERFGWTERAPLSSNDPFFEALGIVGHEIPRILSGK